jgi:ribonuclease BN (tRNA processing enzyme)
MPSEQRETTCFAARSGDSLLVFDAGTGLRRLGHDAHAYLAEGVREVHLFLTHYHLDHTCGLAYLAGVLPRRTVTIHAPAQELTGVNPEAALAGLLRKPYHPQNLADLHYLRVEPVKGRTEVAGHVVAVRPQVHSDVSVAYRVDDDLVLATDTAPDPGTAEFSAGAGLLLHEAWYARADFADGHLPAGYESHSDVESVAALAAAAGVGRLVLIHLNPRRDEAHHARLAAAARRVFAAAELHDDGETIATNERPARA